MSAEKKRWIVLTAVSVLLAAGVGFLIHLQHQKIEAWRSESDMFRQQIQANRTLIKGTPDLVKEVIIQRESDAVIKGILSDEEGVNNFVRTLQRFAEDSGVSITVMKPQRLNAKELSGEFRRVAYTLDFTADAFEFLSFLDEVESHERLMSVTGFTLASGGRNLSANSSTEIPRHKIHLDLETYVYRPQQGSNEVSIDQYERKRESLIGEIARRARELQVTPFEYKGPRARRDPWIDPRINITIEDFVPIEQQNQLVAELVDMVHEAEKLYIYVEKADNYIAQMKARASLDELLVRIEEQIESVGSKSVLSYIPAERSFQVKVVLATAALRERLVMNEQPQDGPSVTVLQQAIDTMWRHIRASEYEMASEVYDSLNTQLVIAEQNDFKRPYVTELKDIAHLVDVVLEFEALEITITGVAVHEGLRPVALINGTSVTEGELLAGELIVRNIENEFVEFDYRGVRLARHVADFP